MKHTDARFLTPVAQRALRHSAIELYLTGKTPTEVSTVLGVSRQAIYMWIKRHSESGKQGLKINNRGRPKGSELLNWQKAHVVKIIKNYCPDELSMPFYLWTRESVSSLIFNRFEIKYSKWTVGRYLSDWGFTPQKPARCALEQNPNSIKKWLEVEYPMIRKKSKKENATIYWCDEMGLRSDHNSGRTYGIKGKTPVVKRSGNRFSCNMISAITNLGRLYFMVYHENFTSDVFLTFLKRLVRQVDRKVFLIVDRHRAHRSKKVQEWLTPNKEHIHLEFLPAYCPELNPDEFLNQDVKSNLGKKHPKTKSEMVKNLNSHLKRRQKQPKVIQNFVQGCHPEYVD